MSQKNAEFDVIIAGGGPAGLSALLWCADLGLSAILLEKEVEVGGQLLHTHNTIKNYPGILSATGRELRDIFWRQVSHTNIERLTGVEVVKADLVKKTLTLGDGTTYRGKAIIIATGVRRRRLMVPGEDEFCGRGILESGVKALEEVRNKTIMIVGGGDAALENALILSESARKIFVVYRRNTFTARKEFIDRVKKVETIEFLTDTKITAISGKERVETVELEHLISRARSRIETDAVLIRIGVEPNTELFRGQVELDDAGYVKIDSSCATGLPGVFAGGDVADHIGPTISAAVGHGATAVKAILKDLDP